MIDRKIIYTIFWLLASVICVIIFWHIYDIYNTIRTPLTDLIMLVVGLLALLFVWVW